MRLMIIRKFLHKIINACSANGGDLYKLFQNSEALQTNAENLKKHTRRKWERERKKKLRNEN